MMVKLQEALLYDTLHHNIPLRLLYPSRGPFHSMIASSPDNGQHHLSFVD